MNKIIKIFSKKFHIYNAITLVSLFPLILLSQITNVWFFDVLLVIAFVLMLLNAIYIIIKIIKEKGKTK